MTSPALKKLPDGQFCLSGLNLAWQQLLVGIPLLLAYDQPPAVRKRLTPDPSPDEQINQEWHELISPGLEALWQSNYQLMAADLSRLEKDPDQPKSFRIVFPANHAAAWLSALNQVRLVLGTRWDVTEADMNRSWAKLGSSHRDRDILLIHLYACLEELFIEADETWPEKKPGAGSDPQTG